ncbi:MAG: insulinase family protein [Vicinamibacteraceae bacterium]|nr:insulinase family protein [Vicinamibacteraceae bacterium]
MFSCNARKLVLGVLAAVIVPAAVASATVRPPKLPYEMHRLDNGLTVILSEDRSTPIVHVEVWYHVGSKDEPPGRTGFAHLFEHMMFKGSKNVLPEQHMSFVASIGGKVNAQTSEDTTVFWQTVPSQYLPLMLWLEADRMATLRIDEQVLRSEREVVKEERRMRVENQPYGRLQEIIYDQAFDVHPYKHPTIGRMEDLEAASVEDVKAFYEKYYVPQNATLTIVGDFDPAETLARVKQYFGKIAGTGTPVARDIPVEPEKTRERRVTLEEDWPLPVVVVGYHIPFDGHPDSYPLHILSKVLSDGQSSRIYRRLVYEEQLAVGAMGAGHIIEHPNLFYAAAIVAPGRSPETVAGALIDTLDKLVREPISPRELQQTKNQFARDYVLSRQTIQNKASTLAHAVVLHDGDITTADGEFDIFMNVTADDVQRVARTYFTPENRLVLTILTRGQRNGQTGGAR